MEHLFSLNHFLESMPNIRKNDELRDPQIEAYEKVYDHFVQAKKMEHVIVVDSQDRLLRLIVIEGVYQEIMFDREFEFEKFREKLESEIMVKDTAV